MVYHPHVHFVVPGGGVKVDEDGNAIAWQTTPENFLFHHGTLIRVYKPSNRNPTRQRGRWKTRTVAGAEFVRGFAQHTLPRGFQKIRHYGWMSPNSKVRLDEVKWLVWLFLGWTYWLASGHAPQPPVSAPPTLRCAECGGAMRVVAITSEPSRLLSEHALAYLDSG